MLEKFKKAKQAEIAALQRAEENGDPAMPYNGARPDFMAAVNNGRFNIIAEYKRASPSRGIIRQDLEIETVTRQYAEAGAAAISVLTEESAFNGSFDFIQRAHLAGGGRIPLLRKDFIFEPVQIRHTAKSPASAILFIARCIKNAEKLDAMIKEAENLGLACVIEVFDENDLSLARECNAKIIQVNARDLQTLGVSLLNSINMIKNHQPENGEVWIAASGITNDRELLAVKNAGFNAALVGTSLMEKGSPGDNLLKLAAALC